MKKLLFLCLLVTTLGPVHGQDTRRKAVQMAVVRVFDGLSQRDLPLIKNNTTAGFTVLEQGVVWNIDTIAAKIEQLRLLSSFHRENSFDFIQTEVGDSTAWVAYYNTAIIRIKNNISEKHWLESAFLVKEGDTWKVQLLHSTVIPARLKP